MGIISVLSVITLRQDFAAGANSDAGSFLAAGTPLVAIHGWTFLVGPGLLAGFGTGCCWAT